MYSSPTTTWNISSYWNINTTNSCANKRMWNFVFNMFGSKPHCCKQYSFWENFQLCIQEQWNERTSALRKLCKRMILGCQLIISCLTCIHTNMKVNNSDDCYDEKCPAALCGAVVGIMTLSLFEATRQSVVLGNIETPNNQESLQLQLFHINTSLFAPPLFIKYERSYHVPQMCRRYLSTIPLLQIKFQGRTQQMISNWRNSIECKVANRWGQLKMWEKHLPVQHAMFLHLHRFAKEIILQSTKRWHLKLDPPLDN